MCVVMCLIYVGWVKMYEEMKNIFDGVKSIQAITKYNENNCAKNWLLN